MGFPFVRGRGLSYAPDRRAFNHALGGLLLAFTLGAGRAGAEETKKAAKKPFRVLAFGDSLTAGYGLPPEDGLVARLQAWLDERYEGRFLIEDGGVSGDTTAGGLARLDWALGDPPPDLAILELGANDALRGLPVKETAANLRAMMDMLKARKVPVLIAGMMSPRNMGPEYIKAFDGIYPALAKDYGAALDPFFLAGVAGDAKLNQKDGMHPNAGGVKIIVDRIGPLVVKSLMP